MAFFYTDQSNNDINSCCPGLIEKTCNYTGLGNKLDYCQNLIANGYCKNKNYPIEHCLNINCGDLTNQTFLDATTTWYDPKSLLSTGLMQIEGFKNKELSGFTKGEKIGIFVFIIIILIVILTIILSRKKF